VSDCDRVRELIPWYAKGSLPSSEATDVAKHLAECEACRADLATAVRLRNEIEGGLRRLPDLPSVTWSRVVERTCGRSIGSLDVGSFLAGLTLGASVRRGAVPVRGDLRLLGQRIRLFDVRRGGR
jgi:hypothetical protein